METKRIKIHEVAPEAYKAMLKLETYLHGTSLSPIEKELIKIRASQINGCAYCLNMHTRDARKLGETEQRIYLLNVWHETELYTESERIILTLTEEITLISDGGVSEETYQKAEALLGKEKLAEVIMAIITINAWNRIGVSTLLSLD
ncbi:carboxymuconolactone decarboxylase family protein [Dysgonomonas sp. HDW5A]|uniref:carboxymuconolactone decarboxylase family protein n=1 Tax=Dysgonomonas sp. HDW5A TaxID=2714926 RepID=UPI00140B1363|nr:carboxymuconolactone decarboxylase family protein [Dysgonomonas sp. HDW5A]QIK59101.1 carboxymuconolactone decarboxylase family protein [Dysgonomonas sp. HDW5A]